MAAPKWTESQPTPRPVRGDGRTLVPVAVAMYGTLSMAALDEVVDEEGLYGGHVVLWVDERDVPRLMLRERM